MHHEPEVKAAFAFKNDTPNIRDKVIWCPTNNSFKLVVAKGSKGRALVPLFYDENGKSLGVPEGLSAEKHEAAKRDAYARAVLAWNALDPGSRRRISVLPSGPETSAPSTIALAASVAVPVDSDSQTSERMRDSESVVDLFCSSSASSDMDSPGVAF